MGRVNIPKFMEKRMSEKYEINIDTAKNTTLIRCGLGTVELPFALCNDIIKCLDTETLAKLLSDVYLAGFKDGYDSAEFDNEEEVLRARLGDFY